MKYVVFAILMMGSTAIFAKTYEADVTGMDCGHCSQSVEKSVLSTIKGVKSAKADYQTGKLVLQTDDTVQISDQDISAAVKKAGKGFAVSKVSSK